MKTTPRAAEIIDVVFEDDYLFVGFESEAKYREFPLYSFYQWLIENDKLIIEAQRRKKEK